MHRLPQPGESEQIPRSSLNSPNYCPRWRFDVVERYFTESVVENQSNALSEIMLREKDPYVRQLLLFHTGGRCVNKDAISYALKCDLSSNKNSMAVTIAAMVVADRSSEEIAEEIGTKREHVVAYEKLFFDVRRYRGNQFWLKELCYSGFLPWLGKGAARWLITAFERGWAGLAATFSNSNADPQVEGGREWERMSRIYMNRAADFLIQLEMRGVELSAEEIKILQPIVMSLQREGAGNLRKLCDRPPSTWTQKKQREESARLVAVLTLPQRRRVREFMESIVKKVSAPDESEATPGSFQQ